MRLALFAGCAAAVLLAIAVGLVIGTREVMEATENELPAEPVPYWPAEQIEALPSMVTCTRCTPAPTGICTCATGCGHDACQFDQTGLDGFSRDELDMLDGKRGLSL